MLSRVLSRVLSQNSDGTEKHTVTTVMSNKIYILEITCLTMLIPMKPQSRAYRQY